jgi:hypothetical protein
MAGTVAQAVEYQLCKLKALIQTPVTYTQKKQICATNFCVPNLSHHHNPNCLLKAEISNTSSILI